MPKRNGVLVRQGRHGLHLPTFAPVTVPTDDIEEVREVVRTKAVSAFAHKGGCTWSGHRQPGAGSAARCRPGTRTSRSDLFHLFRTSSTLGLPAASTTTRPRSCSTHLRPTVRRALPYCGGSAPLTPDLHLDDNDRLPWRGLRGEERMSYERANRAHQRRRTRRLHSPRPEATAHAGRKYDARRFKWARTAPLVKDKDGNDVITVTAARREVDATAPATAAIPNPTQRKHNDAQHLLHCPERRRHFRRCRGLGHPTGLARQSSPTSRWTTSTTGSPGEYPEAWP